MASNGRPGQSNELCSSSMAFPVDEQFIRDAEAALGVRFPATHRARLARENGGELVADSEHWILYPVFDWNDAKRIKRSASHIVVENESAREWVGFPARAVAIASNGSGDQLVLMPAEADPSVLDPQVYRWDHETRQLRVVAEDVSRLG